MKNKKISTLSVLSILSILGILTAPSTVLAQQASSAITAIPPRLDLKANPGDTLKVELKVANDTDTLQYYTVAVDDFVVVDRIGTPIPVSSEVSGRWSLKNWINAPTLIPVEAKKIQLVKLTIRVPQNAHAGGHYAMLTYQPNGDLRPEELKKTGSLIGHRTGTLLYVTVSGDIKENAFIRQFDTAKFNEFGPVKFAGLIENQSDVHVAPKGTITIKDIFGNIVGKLSIDTGNIFPDSSREFLSSWAQKWGYGRYAATLELAYGATGSVLTSTILFWLFPIRLVIYVLTLITSVLLLIVLLDKKNRRHQEILEAEVKELKKEIDQLEKK